MTPPLFPLAESAHLTARSPTPNRFSNWAVPKSANDHNFQQICPHWSFFRFWDHHPTLYWCSPAGQLQDLHTRCTTRDAQAHSYGPRRARRKNRERAFPGNRCHKQINTNLCIPITIAIYNIARDETGEKRLVCSISCKRYFFGSLSSTGSAMARQGAFVYLREQYVTTVNKSAIACNIHKAFVTGLAWHLTTKGFCFFISFRLWAQIKPQLWAMRLAFCDNLCWP